MHYISSKRLDHEYCKNWRTLLGHSVTSSDLINPWQEVSTWICEMFVVLVNPSWLLLLLLCWMCLELLCTPCYSILTNSVVAAVVVIAVVAAKIFAFQIMSYSNEIILKLCFLLKNYIFDILIYWLYISEQASI